MDATERMEFLKKYGSFAIAYSTLQSRMEYFDMEGAGYIAYMPYSKKKDLNFILGDPICAPEKTEALMDEFLKTVKRPVFFQISEQTGKILEKRGFYINRIGTEMYLPLKKYDLYGQEKKALRREMHKSQKAGVVVKEVSYEQLDKKRIEEISKEWIATKTVNSNEMAFMVRPIEYKKEFFVRYFVASVNNAPVGFTFFDPIFEEGKVIGYYWDIHRQKKDAPEGVPTHLLLSALETFKKEGKKVVELGILACKMKKSQDDDGKEKFRYSSFTRWFYNYSFKNLNWIYNFKGLALNKEKYHGEERVTYFASKKWFSGIEIDKAYEILGVKIDRQLKKTLFK